MKVDVAVEGERIVMDSENIVDESRNTIILVGNPNVGKSVLFNVLTGTYTVVSNYPGTSVAVSRGHCEIDGTRFEILDTPGMYSIMPITEEERVAREMLLLEKPHAVIHVVDARNIERMLPMTLQLIEAGLPVILLVNIIDEAERIGMKIDIGLLQEKLGIPVIGGAMRSKRGLPEVRQAIAAYSPAKKAVFGYSADLDRDIDKVASALGGRYALSRRALALLLLQKDEEILQLVRCTEGENFALVEQSVNQTVFERRLDLHLRISLERKRVCKGVLDGVIQQPQERRKNFADRLSAWTINPWTGFPLLLLVLYFGIYQFVGQFGAGTLVNFFEGILFENYLNPWAIALVERATSWYWLRELLVGEYGLFTLGVRYAVALVLPIVGTFFLTFSIIEDVGYFPRLAMLVDRIFKKIGLNGRAVIPMVLGFGCDTMATMVTRTLETVRERIIVTLLLALAVPCSAQLGVILGLLSGVPLALLIWGFCIALVFLAVGFLSARLMPGEQPMFYMELPPLRLPQFHNVMIKTLSRMQWYFLEIFPLFIIASVLLWAGKMTGALNWVVAGMTPLVRSLGLPAEVSAAFIFGFFRRDFGAAGLFDLHSSGLLSSLQLTVAAVTMTLFVPCIAQFLMMKKERGWKVALSIFLFVSLLAFSVGWLLNRLLSVTGWL
ncbi:MAG: ferrous iron transport protein B [Syntrophotaleaceae bacterium]